MINEKMERVNMFELLVVIINPDHGERMFITCYRKYLDAAVSSFRWPK